MKKEEKNKNKKKQKLKKQYKKIINKIKKNEYKKKLKQIIELLKKNYYLPLMIIPFYLIDLITRVLGKKINFYGIGKLVPNLFTMTWIFLIIGISLSIKNKK